MTLRKLLWIALLPVVAGTVAAQDQADPPSRVARLNYVYGNVSYRPGSVDEWAPASANYPLTTGDRLWTEPNSSAELRIGSASLRLAGQVGLGFLNLDDRSVQVSLSQGAMNVRIAQLAAGQVFEVDTPNGAVTLQQAGEYRIDVNSENNFTSVTVRSGEALVTGEGKQYAVPRGQQSRFAGTDELTCETGDAPAADSWDQWCESRDHRAEVMTEAVSAYVPAEMTGSEDLADPAIGTWTKNPEDGEALWIPKQVDPGWEPYRFGHWAYVEPWGWTWIDDASWGFAPFHYGRWMTMGGAWAWAPGSFEAGVMPIWSPALVAFLGGDGLGMGISAWVPLGPHEAFMPWYAHSRGYIQRVNIGRNINVTNVTYVNRGHVVAVNHMVFAGGGHVGASARVPQGVATRLRPVSGVNERPSNAARLGSTRQANRPPATSNRQVFTKTALPPSAARTAGTVRVANPTATAAGTHTAAGMARAPGAGSAAGAGAAGHASPGGSPQSSRSTPAPGQIGNPALANRPGNRGTTPASNVTNPALRASSPSRTSPSTANRPANAENPINTSRKTAPVNPSRPSTAVNNSAVRTPAASDGRTPKGAGNPAVSRPAAANNSRAVNRPSSPSNSSANTKAPRTSSASGSSPSPRVNAPSPAPRTSTPAPRVSAPAPAPRVSTPAPRVSVPIKR